MSLLPALELYLLEEVINPLCSSAFLFHEDAFFSPSGGSQRLATLPIMPLYLSTDRHLKMWGLFKCRHFIDKHIMSK